MSAPEPYKLSTDDERWEVSTHPAGDSVRVSPARGLMDCDNWELFAGRRGSYLWRLLFIGGRRCYPKTEKQLAKAVADCQRFCDRENAKEDAGRRLAASLGSVPESEQ